MLSKRLETLTPSYTLEISSKIRQLKDLNLEVIDLSIGEPNFNVPIRAKLYGIESLNNNYTRYDTVTGIKPLKEEICKKLLKENNCTYCPEDIVVSSGAKHCLTNTLLALTNPNDEVLIPIPYWVSYPEIVKIVNAIPVFIHTSKDNSFKIRAEDLSRYISKNTKALILNNPNNPTGSIYTKNELEEIVEICYKNNIYILADEIYEKICYKDNFTSIASISNLAKDITITINGFSKSTNMTGLRLGYTASNSSIAKAISSIQGHSVSHPCITSQYIAYGALKECNSDINQFVDEYKLRRKLICAKLDSINNISYIKPYGAFYVFIDISKLKNTLSYNESFSLEFCSKFLDTYNVAVVPGIAFGLDDYIRISFACDESVFLEGVDRLDKFINSFS